MRFIGFHLSYATGNVLVQLFAIISSTHSVTKDTHFQNIFSIYFLFPLIKPFDVIAREIERQETGHKYV